MRTRSRRSPPSAASSPVSIVAHAVIRLAALQPHHSVQYQLNGDSKTVAISVDQSEFTRGRGTIRAAELGLAACSTDKAMSGVGPQAMIYFAVAGGSLALALSLLYARYVRQDPQAVRSRGGFTLFALCMLLFALGAAAAGLVSVQAGR